MASAPPPPESASLIASFNAEAQTYDIRLGTATRAVADFIIDRAFPSLQNKPPQQPVTNVSSPSARPRARVLDIAAGTGAFALTLADRCLASRSTDVAAIWATDIAPNMMDLVSRSAQARGLLDDENAATALTTALKNGGESVPEAVPPPLLLPRMQTAVCDGQDLSPVFPRDGVFDLIVVNFGLFFYPDPVKGVKEMYRLLDSETKGKEAATAVVTCWNEMGSWPVFLEVQRRIAPAKELTELKLGDAWADGSKLVKTLKEGGSGSVEIEMVPVCQWREGYGQLAVGMAELFRGMLVGTWSEEEMEMERLSKVTEQVLREMGEELGLVEVDAEGKMKGRVKGLAGGRVGFKLTACIATARK